MKLQDIKYQLGSDPELALFDTELDRIVPANGLVPGTKTEPFRLSAGTVQIDGTCIELGPDPGRTEEEFINNIRVTVQETRDILNAHSPGRYELRCGDTLSYHDHDIAKLPKTVFDVGCEPAYSLNMSDEGTYQAVAIRGNTKESPKRVPIGGHLHLGFTEGQEINDALHLLDCTTLQSRIRNHMVYKQLRVYQGERFQYMPSIRNSVRIKSYGFELRSLNSTWLCDEGVARAVFRMYEEALAGTVGDALRLERSTGINDEQRALLRSSFNSEVVAEKYQQTLPLGF